VVASANNGHLAVESFGQALVSPAGGLEARVAGLYEAHRDRIYRFLVGQGMEPAVAQEATQDVFVDLFVALRKNSSNIRSEQGWLYAVAARAAVDYWRRDKRPMWVELDGTAGFAATERVSSPEASPEAQTLERERLRRVADALQKLPKEQRMCVNLRMQGMRYREMAEILGVSTSTAAEWLTLAVERLRGACHH
jgi:RNA polymerase sigma-70 factor (ECF subfamily)